MQQLSTICYLDNGKQLLLLHRNKRKDDIHEGKWVSVGGKFEPGESPKECAIREIYEETGLKAKSLIPLGFITFPDFTKDQRDWYSFVYRVTDFEGEVLKDCDEGTLEWVDYDKVLDKPTWEGDYLFLQWILDDRPFFWASFSYDEKGTLIDQKVEFMENRGEK
ncbi:NUDIX hydrolase [Facklamia miroungae]|uniref:8-oxo-dGTP diphosphatase n=1 Tax=Facklamia miroungae TaxID=120956 RepID=A0A1G7SY63_9LACT|nr:8-oxo-dGTP diphosphatase [Facklamia miroungae]NKZ29486.1 8-oxo-dGTP diphosphatase [Facklamia miroungae]SDG28036.1 8-oxo-dGTP diphosphatase [Facklamia miroungae]